MPCDWSLYPKDWKEIRAKILKRAENRCEFCGAPNGQPHWKTSSKVVLTTAHKNHDVKDNREVNLVACCQRCHNLLDIGERIKNRKKKKEARCAIS